MMQIVSCLWIVVASSSLLLVNVGTAASSASSSSFSSTTTTASSLPPVVAASEERPDWLNHIDPDTIQEYIEKAKKQHKECIELARNAYNVKMNEVGEVADSIVSDLSLKSYSIHAAGKLPDFHTELDRKCFVTDQSTPLFTKEECKDLIDKVETYFDVQKDGKWSTLPSGQYDVAGFWIRDIPEAHEWFLRMVQKRLFPLLSKTFPHFCKQNSLVVDNAYLFKYTPETGRRTDVHTDSGCLSFTISLNPNEDYDGGGTWFEGLQKDDDDDDSGSGSSGDVGNVIEMDVGQVTIRPGGVRHCGNAVTRGTRYIIGGFCMDERKVEHVRMLLRYANDNTDPEEEQKALEVAICLNPHFDAPYTVLADVYQKRGNIPKAQQVLEHCFHHVNPQCGEVAYSLGTLYYDQQNYRGAKECMEACLRADDCDVDAMMVLSQVSAKEQNLNEEKQWYERIVSTPGAKDTVAASAYCNLGVIHAGTEEEIQYYHQSLRLRPDAFETRYSLACAHGSRKQWNEAVDEFRKALGPSSVGGTDDQRLDAIKALYRVVQMKIQNLSPPLTSQQEAMDKFREYMGEENFNQLASLSKTQQ